MKWSIVIVITLLLLNPLQAKDKKSIEVLYLQILQPERPTLSNLDPIPEDLGLKGAELGAKDNNRVFLPKPTYRTISLRITTELHK